MKTITIKNVSENDLDYFKRLAEETGFTSAKTFNELITAHIENAKTKELLLANQEAQSLVEQQNQQIQGLQKELEQAKERLQRVFEIENQLNLSLRPEVKEYFLNISLIAKRDGYAHSPEELFENMLKVFHKRGEFLLDKSDMEYINQLKQNGHAK